MPAAPPLAAARATRRIVSGVRIGSPGYAWQETTRRWRRCAISLFIRCPPRRVTAAPRSGASDPRVEASTGTSTRLGSVSRRTAPRSACHQRSPRPATPPPMTTAAGSSMLTSPPTAEPTAAPPSRTTSRAVASPSAARAATDRRSSTGWPVRRTYSWARPGPEAIASRCPCPPQVQGNCPAYGEGWWPACPATEWAPASTVPSTTNEAPIPVPTARKSIVWWPAATPWRVSPRACACTSLMAETGRSSSPAVGRRRSVPAQPARASVAESTRPVRWSITPALPTPRARTRVPVALARNRSTRSAAVSRMAVAPARPGVGAVTRWTTSPSRSRGRRPSWCPRCRARLPPRRRPGACVPWTWLEQPCQFQLGTNPRRFVGVERSHRK